MVNKNRDYGLNWERELVRIFKDLDKNAKRTPNSGAYGTQFGVSSLQGDVLFRVDGMNFLVEAKAGYGGATQMTLKRRWMEKTVEEANNQSPRKIPILALKMKGGKKDSSKLVVFRLNDFVELMMKYYELNEELKVIQDENMKLQKRIGELNYAK